MSNIDFKVEMMDVSYPKQYVGFFSVKKKISKFKCTHMGG